MCVFRTSKQRCLPDLQVGGTWSKVSNRARRLCRATLRHSRRTGGSCGRSRGSSACLTPSFPGENEGRAPAHTRSGALAADRNTTASTYARVGKARSAVEEVARSRAPATRPVSGGSIVRSCLTLVAPGPAAQSASELRVHSGRRPLCDGWLRRRERAEELLAMSP